MRWAPSAPLKSASEVDLRCYLTRFNTTLFTAPADSLHHTHNHIHHIGSVERLFFFFKERSESWLIIQILDWGHALLKKKIRAHGKWENILHLVPVSKEMSRSSGVQYNNTCFLETWSEVLNANWEANFVALAATTKVSQVPCSMLSYTRTMPLQKYKMEEVRGLCSMLLRWTAGLWNIWRA